MKITLSTNEIADYLKRDENAGWSWAGAKALAEHLEQFEQDSGEEVELDVVAIRCDYSEHGGLQDWSEGYFGGKDSACEEFNCTAKEFDAGDADDKIREHIQDNGQLIEFSGGIIVSSF
jgi:hypothetical protein